MRVAVMSETGARDRNEDACGWWQGALTCCVLADGAGGHGGGDSAARLAVRTVLDDFVAAPEVRPGRIRALLDLANRSVMRAQALVAAHADMRTTLVVVALDPASLAACWGHIGDSRLYCFRQGYVVFRTRDHSVVQSFADAGIPVAGDSMRIHRSLLTGSIGSEDGYAPDVPASVAQLQPGDALLMCSDGLWDRLDDRELERTLQVASSPADWLASMRGLIEAEAVAGQDNYSAIAIWCGDLDFTTRAGAVGGDGTGP